MKIEKTATFDETKLFHEYPVGRYGYVGYICGYFKDGSTKYNITGIEMTPEIKEELESGHRRTCPVSRYGSRECGSGENI